MGVKQPTCSTKTETGKKVDRFRTLPRETLKRQRCTMSVSRMADFNEVSQSVVYAVLREHGIRGVPSGACKLTPDQVRRIRKEFVTERNLTRLGRRYGVTPMTISDVVYGKTWKWVKS